MKLIKTYIPQRGGKNLKKSFSFGKKDRLQNRYRNWTLVSVPNTETEFRSHTTMYAHISRYGEILHLENEFYCDDGKGILQ